MFSPQPRFRSAFGLPSLIAAIAFCPIDGAAQLVINEVQATNRSTILDDEEDSSDWVELVNISGAEVNLFGHALSDDASAPRKWIFPDVRVAAGDRLLVWCSGKDRTSPPDEVIENAATEIPFLPSLVNLQADWRYLTGTPDQAGPDPRWKEPDFDDSAWPLGKPAFGFGEDFIVTPLPEGCGAAFMRLAFDIADPHAYPNLVLQTTFDDGFVAYLNGTRVSAANYTNDADPTFASTASRASSEARRATRSNLTSHLDLLRPGRNVLAVAMLNLRATSADMAFAAELGHIPPVLHTSFSLDDAGENLFLTGPTGELIDAILVPPTAADRSYGRFADASGPFFHMLFPTPLAANDEHVSGVLIPSGIDFDRPGGKQEGAVDVTLSANVPFPGFVIRYTTNGDLPSSDSTLFEAPIEVRRDTNIRAAGFLPDGRRVTAVTSRTYYGFTATTRSLVLPAMAISMLPADFQRVHMLSDARGRGSERPGQMEIYDAENHLVADPGMGLRLHGGAGRSGDFNTKKAYRVYFRSVYGDGRLRYPLIPDTHVADFDRLVLRANFNDAFRTGGAAAFIRDQVIRDLHEDMGALVSHGTWFNLLVNARLRGIYNVVERIDTAYFASYFPEIGEQWDIVRTFEEVQAGDNRDWNQMKSFFQRSNLAQDALYEEAKQLIDIENFTSYMFTNIWAQNHDWPHNNWYAARPRIPGGRWIFLCWDAEFGIGLYPSGHTSDTFTHALQAGAPFSIILSSLLRNKTYQRYFLDEVDRHLANALSAENVLATIRRHAGIIEADVTEEALLTGNSIATWRANIRTLETFAQRRGDAIRTFIHNSSVFGFPRALSVSPRRIDLTEGAQISIRGQRFTQSTTVELNDLPAAAVQVVSSREIVATLPFDASLEGRPRLTLIDPENGRSTSEGLFTVELVVPEPQDVLPASGAPGDQVIISGDGFLDGVRVEFAGVPSPAVERIAGSTEVIRAVVPHIDGLPEGAAEIEVRVVNTRPRELASENTLRFTYTGGSSPPSLLRGDADGDGTLAISDPVTVLRYLTGGSHGAACADAFDADDSGAVQITDAIVVLSYLFRDGSPAPAAPFPECGADPSDDALGCQAAPAACAR